MTSFVSTRGRATEVGFIDALLGGLAADGGLHVPAAWPEMSARWIAALPGRPYADVAADILGCFAGDEIDPAALSDMCWRAYGGFDHPAVAPLRQLDAGAFLLELFHGPSLAFKDIALQLLARLAVHALERRGRRMTIVCATSGDTGGAAVEAFAGLDHVRIVALFPEGRISEVQRRFMTTSPHDNVACLSVAGDFDDCQELLKGMFGDRAFVSDVGLAAVNSINFIRIIAQSVYYFTAAAALGAPERAVSFVVPTGNFGDAFAGWAAHRMGLPLARILAATNRNAIVARALEDGAYVREAAAATMSPAMDIQVASNFERLFFECAGRDGAATAAAFKAFARTGRLTLPHDILTPMRTLFRAASVDEAETAATMDRVRQASGILIDPHTAVAVAAAARADLAAPRVILATAHPAKFPEAVRAATGAAGPVPRPVARRARLAERVTPIAADAGAVKAFVRDFAG